MPLLNTKLLLALMLAVLVTAMPVYAITLPPGVVNYVPVTITNYQASAVSANSQIILGASNAFSSGIIGINMIQYQSYETPTLNNTIWFYGNGTIIPTWLEGNYLNLQTYNDIATSVTSVNALSTSANVVWIAKIAPSTFLTANAGSFEQNTIYLGFAGSTISPSNTLFSVSNDGAAPYLTKTYGFYDSGANVFTSYNRWGGLSANSMAAGFTNSGYGANVLNNANSTLLFNAFSSGGQAYNALPTTAKPLAFDVYGVLAKSNVNQYFGFASALGFSCGDMAYVLGNESGNSGNWKLENGGCTDLGTGLTENKLLKVYSVSTNSGGTVANALINYTTKYTVGSLTSESTNYLNFYGTVNALLYWDDVRIPPPNGIMPGYTIESGIPGVTISIIPNPITAGSAATITGTCPYSVADNCAIESSQGAILANTIGTGSVTYTTPALPIGQYAFSANDLTATYASNTATGTLNIIVSLNVKTWNGLITETASNTVTPSLTYPVQFYTHSPSSNITFGFNEISPIAQILQANVLNISYVPPSNQLTGNYVYNAIATEFGNTITITESINGINMQDITGAFTFNAECSAVIEYFPNCVIFPLATNTFVAKPTTWNIGSDYPGNQHPNQTGSAYNLAQFSNANLTFNDIVTLTYGQFTPALTFIANVINNPQMTNTISQAKGCNTAFFATHNSSTASSGTCQRNLYDILTYNELTQGAYPANTTFSATVGFNNYSIPLQISTLLPASSNNLILMPNSLYQNPTAYVYNQIAFSSGTSMIPIQNNYFNTQYTYGQLPLIRIYLVPIQNGTSYSVSATACNNYAQGDYLKVMEGVSGAQIQVQLYKMSQFPFSIPLLSNGYPYQFYIYSPSEVQLYQSAISTWVSPISLQAGCQGVNVSPIIVPQIQTSCTSQNIPGNQMNVVCTGTDFNNLVNSWIINFTNQTSLLYSTVLKSYTVTSDSFTVNYIYPSNKSEYPVVFTWNYGLPGDAPGNQGSATITVGNTSYNNVKYPELFYVALFLILLPLALAYFKQDFWILVELFGISIGEMIELVSPAGTIPVLPFTVADIAIFYVIGGSLLAYNFFMRR